MDFGSNSVKLPADVAKVFDYQKQVPRIAIRGIGEVDFTSISLAKARKIVEQTGSKYLVEKKTVPAHPPKISDIE